MSLPDPDARAYVYVFKHSHGVKVGLTTRTPGERLLDLQRESGMEIEHVASFGVKDRQRARIVEAWALHELREHRTFGEWHSCDPDKAVEAMRWAVEHAPPSTPAFVAQLRDCGVFERFESKRRQGEAEAA